MNKEIKYLRKKFFILSALISFIIIFVMLLILNLLMYMSSENDLETATDMVNQIAYSNSPNIDLETVLLNDTEKNPDGDHIIVRDPKTVESITLNGEIKCDDKNADWYCAGGGIYFEIIETTGEVKYIYKEYKFNRGNTKITIDFLDTSDYLYSGEPIQIDATKASQEHFYVSSTWWTSSSTTETINPTDVELHIESIEIQYRKNVSVASSENYEVIERDFYEIYPTGMPQTLSNFCSFYLITDKQNNLIEINSGNSLKQFSQEDINSLIHNTSKSELIIDDTKFKCFVTDIDNQKIHTYIYNIQAEENSRQLLLMSILSGNGIFILVLVLIYLISGKVVKPISESYQKQKEFISNVSHELKTPITVISATTELMEKKNGSDKLTNCVQAQSQKMSRLVNEMLTLTRLSEFEKQVGDFKQFNISQLVSKSVLYFESRAFEEGKRIQSNINENLVFTGNADKIDELVGILLDNALKYSDENSEIKISLYPEKENIVLTCENPCKNFNTDDISHIFERFYRADKSHSNEKEGFGLGLSIAKEIIDIHNSTIFAEYKNNMVIFNLTLKKLTPNT